ncbi:MAG: DUF1987 domain-containing protein [Cyclobacteriaceae bacterium]
MNERNLKIEPTDVTPFFLLDPGAGTMEFRGRSLPCASQRFYHPIIRKIENVFEKGTISFTANFALEYFNTSSSKCLFDILKKLAMYKNNGANVVINWFYEEFDEDMRETGEDYENILGVSFNHIPI